MSVVTYEDASPQGIPTPPQSESGKTMTHLLKRNEVTKVVPVAKLHRKSSKRAGH